MRKDPRNLTRQVVEALGSDPQTIDAIAKRVGCSWITAWKYLELIDYVQRCPRVGRVPAGKRIEMWRREWGKLPT